MDSRQNLNINRGISRFDHIDPGNLKFCVQGVRESEFAAKRVYPSGFFHFEMTIVSEDNALGGHDARLLLLVRL